MVGNECLLLHARVLSWAVLRAKVNMDARSSYLRDSETAIVHVVVVVVARLSPSYSPPVLEEVGSGVRRAQSSAVERPRKQNFFSFFRPPLPCAVFLERRRF